MASFDPSGLPDEVLAFLRERHLGTLTTLRADGSPHVVPVGFAYDPADGVVRVITQTTSQKAANVRRGSRAVVCQLDGGRWLSLEGTARVVDDAEGIQRCADAYAARYQAPREARAATRIGLEITVDRVMGRP
jgi:F420H(2)-dependent biliverdin reductase